jgi:hypothetical protein
MTFARDLAPANTSAFNKLTRTFAMQIEALKRYRSGADQKVTLQHVSVAEGGQAIVGNVTQAPHENGQEKAVQEKAATPPPTLPDTNVVPMPSMDKSKEHDRTWSAADVKQMNGDQKRNTGARRAHTASRTWPKSFMSR